MNKIQLVKYTLITVIAFSIGTIFGWYKSNQAYQSNAIFRASILAFDITALRNNKINQVISTKDIELDNEIGNYALYIYSKNTDDPFYITSLKKDFTYTIFGLPSPDEDSIKSAISRVVNYKNKYQNTFKPQFKCTDTNSSSGQFNCDLENSWAISNKYSNQFINEQQ